MAKQSPAKTARAAAAQVIAQVCQHHRALNGVLRHAQSFLPDKDKALCQQLCYGVLRWQPQLSAIASQLLNKPLKAKDADINALLLLGLYQLRDMRLPEHAILSETVNACQTLGKPWAKGLINATLRQYLRQQDAINTQLSQDDVGQFAHPQWIIDQLKHDWPEDWQAILQANNQQPPLFLRVNSQQTNREDYLQQLQQHHIAAKPVAQNQEGILLDTPCDVFQLPGFLDGAVSVQDGAAQLVASIADIQPGQRLLDACAAPGGKTCHLLEKAPSNTMLALDIDGKRLEQVQENLDRLQLQATLTSANASDTDSWWDGTLFDRILIDAPCSGTGVIRRHPDIKQLRRESDIEQLVQTQQQLLESLWPLLNTNGVLIYTTCSVFQQENTQQIMWFLTQHPEAEELLLSPEPAMRQPAGYQRLPGQHHMDGFFYACLRRR